MARELVISVVSNDCPMVNRTVESRLRGANAAFEAGRNVNQMIVECDELTFKLCGVGRDVALALADHKLLIAA